MQPYLQYHESRLVTPDQFPLSTRTGAARALTYRVDQGNRYGISNAICKVAASQYMQYMQSNPIFIYMFQLRSGQLNLLFHHSIGHGSPRIAGFCYLPCAVYRRKPRFKLKTPHGLSSGTEPERQFNFCSVHCQQMQAHSKFSHHYHRTYPCFRAPPQDHRWGFPWHVASAKPLIFMGI